MQNAERAWYTWWLWGYFFGFLELNLRKVKWPLFGGYNPHKDNISNFVRQLDPIVDIFLSTYDNLLLLGDFNPETSEFIMKDFCEMYNLNNLIKDPTRCKNSSNPSSVDVMLTNRPRSFLNSTTYNRVRAIWPPQIYNFFV